ncbi:DUF2484 family protein [Pseudooceanicola algae]|nr:DUF2484 family protein [Pseudooceanicola algae]
MSESFLLLMLWGLGALAAGYLGNQGAPRRGQRQRLAALTGTGIPVLGYITAQHGPWVGLLVLLLGFAVLAALMARVLQRVDGSPG